MPKNFRCSGGDNRGHVNTDAIERAEHGWDDREVFGSEPMDTENGNPQKEEELSTHF